MNLRKSLRSVVPPGLWIRLRYVYKLALDTPQILRFLTKRHPSAGLGDKLGLMAAFLRTDRQIDCAHTTGEILWFVDAILSAPADLPGDFAECGAFKGGSTAKFSRACKLAGRQLLVFDSFEGIPENDETDHATLDGENHTFPKGSYRGGGWTR